MNSPAEVFEFVSSLNPQAIRRALSSDPLGSIELERISEAERLREALFDVLDARPALFRQLREEAAAIDAMELAQMWLPFGKGAF